MLTRGLQLVGISSENQAAGQDVVLTAVSCAGPWGLAASPQELDPVVDPRFRMAAPQAMDITAANIPHRQARYLGRNCRLALAAAWDALRKADYHTDPALRERLGIVFATSPGPDDPETSAAILLASENEGEHGRPSLAAALKTYRERRTAVQYLLSMETAVVGQVGCALAARGPSHAVTTPGLAGGAQALVRGILAVSRGDAPAVVAGGVLSSEDRSCRVAPAMEAAGAVVLENRNDALARGRTPLATMTIEFERFGLTGPEEAVVVLESEPGEPYAGAATPFLALAGLLHGTSPSAGTLLEFRSVHGHSVGIRL